MPSRASQYRVRVAVQSDCIELARMRCALGDTMKAENPNLWPMTEARKASLPDFFEQSINDPDVGVWVAERLFNDGAATVATMSARIRQDRDVSRVGVVDDAWVDPEHRGRGLCRRLMGELATFFRQRGIVDLTLGFVQGGAAGEVWQHFGFRPVIVLANARLDQLNLDPTFDP